MPNRHARRTHAEPRTGRTADAIAAFLLAAAVLASWTAVDPKSIDSYDPPKAMLAATGIALAAAAALASRVLRRGLEPPGISLPAALLLAGAAGAAVSALASPRRAASLDALRLAAVFLLALPLGASEAYRRHRGRIVAVFGAAAALNGLLVVLAAARIWSPLVVYGYSARSGLGALVGNAGYAGIALALAAVTLLPIAVRAGRGRAFAIAAIVLCGAGLLSTQSLSAVAVAAAGTAVYAFFAGSRRIRIGVAAAAAVILLAAVLYRPMRVRVARFVRAARQGEWNAAFTARAAPWLAAAEMIRAHPAGGIGIGNFGAEYVPARIAAEARIRRRLVLPGMPTNSFAQAHNDYLDLFAATGIPAGLCVVAAFAALLGRLVRRARGDPSAAGAAALLTGAAVAAFAWFPFQIVPTALWILLESGRADRAVRERA
ncbi:MAG TPA: O-antigen ligase family protein [Thermoanaerobaculia bacterium]|jgi:O-antigen ligase|nr:O-antigen ligase family protein [Thermoanaerobaculia bacterium]